VLAGHVPRSSTFSLTGCDADGSAGLAFALPDAAHTSRVIAERRDLDLGYGDGNVVFAPTADELAAGDVVLQVATDGTTNDLLEPVLISFDIENQSDAFFGAGALLL
jgi:hypothetical protein